MPILICLLAEAKRKRSQRPSFQEILQPIHLYSRTFIASVEWIGCNDLTSNLNDIRLFECAANLDIDHTRNVGAMFDASGRTTCD